MKQNNTIQQQHEINTLQGHKIQPLVHAAWNFAYIALWSNCIFSSLEKERAKSAIRRYLVQCPDPDKAYYNFCQRVLLAKEFVSKAPDRFIPLPAHWLDASNLNGFAGTKAWLDQMLDKRSSLPLYRRAWKALAEAVLEMANDASEKNFWYWKIYFLERRESELWKLFLGTVTNMQFEK